LNIDELRDDLSHMDEVEMLAFGRQHRANPDSVEYREAQLEWQRRQKKEPKPALVAVRDPSTQDFARMAAAAGPNRYPWIRYQG
jgi:hypothetical protein